SGFAAEEAAGIPVAAADRNYRDPFHKPELVLALEPFEALCGFRDPAAARADLDGLSCGLAETLRGDLSAPDVHTALRGALTRLLTLGAAGREQLVGDFIAEWKRLGSGAHHDTLVELAERYPGDPGAVAALLLNRVSLQPGE